MNSRIDSTNFLKNERKLLTEVTEIASERGSRPSILLPFILGPAWCFGVLTATGPRKCQMAIFGALQVINTN